MLDITFVRENNQAVKKAAEQKGMKVDIDQLLKLDDQRREVIVKVDEARAERNELASHTKGQKPSAEQIAKGKDIKDKIAVLEADLNRV